MADGEIQNLHSKQTAFGYNSKLKILPVRCQVNTFSKSKGKREVNFLIIVALLKKSGNRLQEVARTTGVGKTTFLASANRVTLASETFFHINILAGLPGTRMHAEAKRIFA